MFHKIYSVNETIQYKQYYFWMNILVMLLKAIIRKLITYVQNKTNIHESLNDFQNYVP